MSAAASLWWLDLEPVIAPTGVVAAEFDAYRANAGYVPTMMQALAHRPNSFLPYRHLANSLLVEQGMLDPVERETIALVVSVENRCDLCVISHAAQLRALKSDDHLVGIIEVNYRRAGLSKRMRAMADFAIALTTRANELDKRDIDHLRAVGLCDQTILELAWIASFFNMSNRLMSGLGVRSQSEAYLANRQPADER